MKKTITNFPDYTADETGKIWDRFGHCLKIQFNKAGLAWVGLYRNRQKHSVGLAKLILDLFGPEQPDHYIAGYKDGNKANCHIDNLFWTKRPDHFQHGPRGHRRRKYSSLVEQHIVEQAKQGRVTQELVEEFGENVRYILTREKVEYTRSPKRPMTKEKADEIRQTVAKAKEQDMVIRQRDLAEKYSVSESLITLILQGKRWV